MWQQIKALNEARGEKLTALREILKKAEVEKRDLTAEESGKFDEISEAAEALTPQIERLQRAYNIERSAEAFRDNGGQANGEESRAAAGKSAVGSAVIPPDEQRAAEQRAEFKRWMNRKPDGPKVELRALTVSGQGVVGDRPFYNQVIETMKAFAGVREAGATIIPTANGNDLTVPTSDDTSNTGRLVGENTTNSNVTEPTLGVKTLKAYKFDSDWIKVSVEMLQDADYNIEGLVASVAGERNGRAFNTYATTGTGTSQPGGVMTQATVGKTAAATNAVTYDELLDLVHSVDPAYRASGRCKWQLHDTTLAAIRKLKDGNGRYIWLPGEAGMPDRLLGYGYVVNNDIAQLTSGVSSLVAAFGDHSRYMVRDITGVTVIRADELFIADGLIGYKVWSRHDGLLSDTKAVKTLKLAAA